MMFSVHSSECDWAQEAASARADGELVTEFDHLRLTAHLRACAGCRMAAAATVALARELRDAPLEQPRVPVVLPRRHRVPALRIQAAAVALVAGAVGASFGVGHVLGNGNRARTATGSSRPTSPACGPIPSSSTCSRCSRTAATAEFASAPRLRSERHGLRTVSRTPTTTLSRSIVAFPRAPN